MKSLIKKENYFKTVIDTLPLAVFVVDRDFNINDLNPAARALFGIDSNIKLRQLCGKIIHCLNALESKDGCGTAEACPDCVIRNSVEDAGSGHYVHRTKYRMKIQKNDKRTDVHMLVTASPFNLDNDGYVLLTVEDITEVITLRRLIPICATCKKYATMMIIGKLQRII